jgi:hypothetical protein
LHIRVNGLPRPNSMCCAWWLSDGRGWPRGLRPSPAQMRWRRQRRRRSGRRARMSRGWRRDIGMGDRKIDRVPPKGQERRRGASGEWVFREVSGEWIFIVADFYRWRAVYRRWCEIDINCTLLASCLGGNDWRAVCRRRYEVDVNCTLLASCLGGNGRARTTGSIA